MTRAAVLAGLLLSLAVALSFALAQLVEEGAIDGVATALVGVFFLLAWGIVMVFLTRVT